MEQSNDDVRNRFTAWMQMVVKRAKIDYIRRTKRYRCEVQIDKGHCNRLLYDPLYNISEGNESFSFENLELSNAFASLSPKQRKVLEYIFIHNMTSAEIAKQLNCSIQNVYNLRTAAIKVLKQKFEVEVK